MKTKRFLSILLSLVLVLGMLPGMSLTASAAGNTTEITPSNTSGAMTITLIIKGDPAATDFDVTLPTALAYDGTAKTASATAKSTVTGMGTITVEYYKDGTKVDSAVEIGDYTVKLKVAAGTHYNAGTVENADWKFTITKGTATVTQAPTAKALTYTGSAQELVSAGEATGGEMQYAIGTNTTTAPTTGWSASIPTATNAGTYYVWYKVDPATNYNGVVPACIVVEIKKVKGVAEYKPNEDVREVKGVDLDDVKTQLDKIAPVIANADNTGKGDNQIKDITVTLETKAVTANTVPKDEVSAIMQIANNKIPSSDQESSKISYLNITVKKNVIVYNVDGNGMPVSTSGTGQDTTLTTLPGVIDIPVQYDLTNLHNLQVVRYHGAQAEAFTKLDKEPTTPLRDQTDQTFFVEGSGATAIVHIYTKEFSTYALITSGTKEYKNESSTTTPTEKTEPTTKDESVTVYRLYYGPTMEHFYTTSAYERRVLIDKYGWVDEGIAWKSPKAPTTDEEKKTIKPVYRLFNPFTTDHHYTKDPNERKTLIDKYGWKDEGVAFYSNDKGDATVYRLWHPGLITGAHHFTTGKHEYDVLITRGWIGETEAFKVNAAS
uniref:DUF5648 domain-containing protein n=1 Tax=Eubacterium cellulosolvens (strain ATCC 43171 / JCM 9499 / 6) TaxID=633697 RepID=I5AQ24_EUBC6